MRIVFLKINQRTFLKQILEDLACPSLKELQNRLLEVSYSNLKNYYSERRSIPYQLFLDLCKLSNKNFQEFDFKLIEDNWGQVKGGKNSRR